MNTSLAEKPVIALSRDGLGGGAIMSCLTHQIDALRWFGGEFTTYTDWEDAIAYAFEKEFFMAFVSNGTRITRHAADGTSPRGYTARFVDHRSDRQGF